MPRTPRETTLPDGTRIFCLSPFEAGLIYNQVPEYFRHGITVEDGDTVFDVGANIGLFGLWVSRLGRRDVRIYSFEPIPRVFEVLRRNARRFDPERWQVLPCGLARAGGTATFDFHVHCTACSTAFPDTAPDARGRAVDLIDRNLAHFPRGVRWLRWLPRGLRRRLVDLGIRKVFKVFKTRQVRCPMRTVSEILREHALARIDLLKVDVERGEHEVLAGIEDGDWPRIRQVVAEVHDLGQRVATLSALLKGHGFTKVAVEQESILKGSDIYCLYASRRGGVA